MTVNIKNRSAKFEYEILDKFVAGISLTGTEIKSIRNGKANIKDGFCVFEKDELFVRNIHISEYAEGTYNNHETKRDRKLLLNRTELNKLQKKLKDVGLTIVPLRLFISTNGWAKLEIATARGKKLYDKREDLKKKDTTRQLERLK